MPKLHLIIPTRRKENLDPCLQSIYKYTRVHDYQIIVIEKEAGFAEKLNEGVRKATGDYLIFLHDDCEVTPGWADVLPGANEVGSFCLGENNDYFDTWGGYIEPPGYCQDPKDNPDYSFWLCIHKEAIKKIGLFDERFTEPMYADVMMGELVRRAGYKIKCLSGKIIHRNGKESGAENEKQRFMLERHYGVKL